MLRITRQQKGGVTWLKIEGKLVGPWVEECRAACMGEASSGRSTCLDLAEITYVDPPGAELLEFLRRQGFRIARRSRFVAELLKADPPA